MAVLSSDKILQEKNTSDPNSITSLAFTHRALSDVSCLSGFKDLERLDLAFNSLNSLEGLKLCVNLKWLSVVQNKLHSLKGIEGITKLTVLNAGKNKLRSMDEVRSLVSLRALILNDNEISSVCKLDQMKELNTLVLSRNPISSLGESLIKLKSITKLSVSNCQLQTIDSALKSCAELKELRVAHNEIMTIPSEISRLTKLQNLDLGSNLITKWSNVKELAPLVNLKNLNLQGNPVAVKENLAKKVKNLLPNLHIFNAKPIDKILGKEVEDSTDKTRDITHLQDEVKTSHEPRNKNSSKAQSTNETVNTNLKDAKNAENKKRRKLDEKDEKSRKTSEVDIFKVVDDPETPFWDLFATDAPEIPTKTNDKIKFDHVKVDSTMKRKKSRKSTKRDNLNVLDDSETPFTNQFPPAEPEILAEAGIKRLGHDQIFRDYDRRESDVISMTIYKRNKKHVKVDPSALSQLDVGLGGASSWV